MSFPFANLATRIAAVGLPLCIACADRPANSPPPAGSPPPQGGPVQPNIYPPQQQPYAPQGGPPAAPPGYTGPPPTQPTTQPAGAPPPAATTTNPPPAAATTAASPAGAPLNPLDPNFLSQIAQAGTAILQQPGAGGLADPTEVGLKIEAARHAPGMTPDGQEAKQDLQAGAHASMMVTLQAGKCYTFVGFSPKVTDLTLTLLAPPFYSMSAGQSQGPTSSPVIANQCPVTPFPIQYKLDIYAKTGAGPIAVQMFSKTK